MLKKLFRGLTFGGLVGFVLGLLFAPQKGEKTRQKVKEALEKGKEKFNELKDEFKKEKTDL